MSTNAVSTLRLTHEEDQTMTSMHHPNNDPHGNKNSETTNDIASAMASGTPLVTVETALIEQATDHGCATDSTAPIQAVSHDHDWIYYVNTVPMQHGTLTRFVRHELAITLALQGTETNRDSGQAINALELQRVVDHRHVSAGPSDFIVRCKKQSINTEQMRARLKTLGILSVSGRTLLRLPPVGSGEPDIRRYCRPTRRQRH